MRRTDQQPGAVVAGHGGSVLIEELLAQRVRTVFGFPSVGVDPALREIAQEPRIDLVIAADEAGAAAAAHGYTSVTREPAAVVTETQWSLPGLHAWFALAEGAHLPITFAALGPGSCDDAVHDLQVAASSRRFGPRVWTPCGCAGGRALVDLRDRGPREPLDIAAARYPDAVALLPPWASPDRSRVESALQDRGIPVVTLSGDDPFPRERPGAWAGRIGYTPSPSVYSSLGSAAVPTRALLTFHDTEVPSWVMVPVIRCQLPAAQKHPETRPAQARSGEVRTGDAPRFEGALSDARAGRAITTRSAAPDWSTSIVRSPLGGLIHAVHERWPDALFVADAGTAHRVVAQDVANAGRETLMTEDLTPMGWSISAGLGAGVGDRHRPIVIVIGDGAAMLGGLGMSLLVAHRIRALVVISRNGTLGDRSHGVGGLPDIDWPAVAGGVGMRAAVLGGPEIPLREVRRVEAAWRKGRPSLWTLATPPHHPYDTRGPVGIAHVDRAQPWKQ